MGDFYFVQKMDGDEDGNGGKKVRHDCRVQTLAQYDYPSMYR